MKILRLRLENLNSLYGRWELDFSSVEYAGSGLFAIVGSTGAGKSTILDAISLALYGRTPRLNVVSANTNEVMSRRTGECFAEVVFEVGNEVYSACWSQRRARKKAAGKLQPVQHKLDNLTTSLAVNGTANQIRDEIKELTGMNFEQFTRSMLLAQGEFSKFLKASTGDRSDILEKITNTMEYSDISKAVHERLRTEEEILLGLESGLSGVKLLRSEELADINKELNEIQTIDREYRTQEEILRSQKVKYERLAELEAEFTRIIRDEEEFRKDESLFAAERLRLERAELVEQYWAEYEVVMELRELQTQETTSLQHCQKELSTLNDRQREAEKAWDIKQRESQVLRTEFERELLLIKEVRELDSEAGRLEARIKELQQEYDEVDNYIRCTTGAIAADSEQLAQRKLQLQKIELYLHEHDIDRALGGELELIVENMKRIRADAAAVNRAEEELVLAEEQKKLATAEYEGGVLERESIARRCEEVRVDISGFEQKSLDLSGGEGIGGIEHKMGGIKTQLHQLKDLERVLQEMNDAKLDVDELDEKIKNSEVGITLVQESFEANTVEKQSVEKEVAHLELELRLFDKIKNLQQRRMDLVEGEPCPLCGSREHPFVKDGIPPMNDLEQRFIAEKGRLALIQKELGLCNDSLTRHKSDLQNYHELLLKSVEKFERIQRDVLLRLEALNLPNLEEVAEIVMQRKTKLEAEHLKFEERVSLLRKYERKFEQRRNMLNTLKDGLLGQEQIVGKLKADMSIATSHLDNVQEDLIQGREKLASIIVDTSKIISRYSDYSEESLVAAQDEIVEDLTRRSDLYRKHKEECEVSKSEYTAFEARLAEMRSGTERECLRRDKLSGQLAEFTAERDLLKNRRRELYQEKDCDAEQERYRLRISRGEELAVEAGDRFRELRDSAMEVKIRVEGLEKSIAERRDILEVKVERFFQNIRSQGFADEIRFLEHKLAPELLALLRQQKTEREELRRSICQRKGSVGNEREILQKELAEVEAYEKVIERLEQVIGLRDEASQRIGALLNMIQQDKEAQELFRERKGEILRQQDICSDWRNLHTLIGSADGKKYRNFAQGLTFDIMLKHANYELSRMSDRYLLRRADSGKTGGAELLDLDVIDKDQAGEVRSARNLSGGESFIVSLALALGLSGMSSRKVEVNSLFLDEGFGTLDEDELDKVLSALSRVQQQGKLIGIISHVSALKERVGVQINVQKCSGGRSMIEGIGCREL